MNIIAVDDEQFALKWSEQEIREALPGCTLSCFNDPDDALAHAKKTQVDIAFLDIEMPGMDGLTLAKRLKEHYSKTNIIFITGYSEYAFKSFGVNPSGYLLKPLSKEAVISAIEELRYPVRTKRVRVQTFGGFEIFVDDKPINFSRRTEAKEVLAYLIDKEGTSATTAEIASALWENNKYTRTDRKQIQTIKSYMMKVLREHGIEDIIIKKWNSMAIDKTKINCDYYDLLAGDSAACTAFDGKYMGYTWSEETAAALCQKVKIL